MLLVFDGAGGDGPARREKQQQHRQLQPRHNLGDVGHAVKQADAYAHVHAKACMRKQSQHGKASTYNEQRATCCVRHKRRTESERESKLKCTHLPR